MMKAAQHSIFISYARKDGAELARRFETDLGANGFSAWLDTRRIAGGAVWTSEIEEALDRAQVVIAVLTTGSFVSEICRAEQLRALRRKKCVIPVLGMVGADIPLHFEARNYRDFTPDRDYGASFKLLLEDIAQRRGVALSASHGTTPRHYLRTHPTLVAKHIDRPQALRALRDTLFEADGHRPVALTALEGMGGIGKTVLARALFDEPIVHDAFPDGLLWATIGREPSTDLSVMLRQMAKYLGVTDENVAADAVYRTAIADKAALVVLDDVWSKADLDAFIAESPRSRFLYTTRDASIAKFSGAREYRLDLLDQRQALELLGRWAGVPVGELPGVAVKIVNECGRLPLAVAIVGALLRDASKAEWDDTVAALRRADRASIDARLPQGQMSFYRAIEISVKALQPELQQCYARLAVLLEDAPVAIEVLQVLWDLGEAETRRISASLVDRSLVQRHGDGASGAA